MIRVVLAVVTLALAGTLFMQWHDWPQSLSPDATPGPTSVESTDAGQRDGSLPATATLPEAKETYASVSERPLFRPQRKPEPPQSEQPETQPAAQNDGSLEGLDLSAVVISPRVTSAWIRDPSIPEQLKRLRLGDEQAGWSVKSILADRIVFERQGETNDLILMDFTQPPPSGSAPAPARPTPARPDGAQRKTPSPPRAIPNMQPPGANQRRMPPIPPQLRPNVPKPPQIRPQ